MNILRLLVTELVFHICLCENVILRNDEPPKAGFVSFLSALYIIYYIMIFSNDG